MSLHSLTRSLLGLALLATSVLPLVANAADPSVTPFRFAIEIEGVEMGRFSSLESLGTASEPEVALKDGVLLSDDFLYDWLDLLDGEVKSLETVLVVLDKNGKAIARKPMVGAPIAIEVVLKDGEPMLLEYTKEIEAFSATITPSGLNGIMIPIIWIGDCCDEEEE